MPDQNGRLDWLKQDLTQLRSEQQQGFASLHRRLDQQDKRIDALERKDYAAVRFWRGVAFIGAPLWAAFCAWLLGWIPQKG